MRSEILVELNCDDLKSNLATPSQEIMRNLRPVARSNVNSVKIRSVKIRF